MRKALIEKFKDARNKWISFHIDSLEFQQVLDKITYEISLGNITSSESINLVRAFKKNEKAWLKYVTVKGRKELFCLCEIITEKNKKISLELSCSAVLASDLLSGTPKSLKLFKSTKDKTRWTKSDDGFDDPISYPPVEEELTELGYVLYKEWQEEILASGLSRDEYVDKIRREGYS